ncbi:hypothetical protein [Streptomyces profundus]|uniref:TPR repeat region-containing protein n=1 Tax=Streptomyces profundus TaxID=2867410 RepID=UPI001D166D23|nr:hypothetical protein [Streptomyces sp. MA3_2.13]UED83395.1 hypothetical protein K4G22_03555 [Streptomyces sp. MA3_2.13]
MSALRLFGYRDVEAKGAKPWTTQQTFSKELNTESMSDTAAAYARASAEARNVDALAGRATTISRDAGSLNGAPLVKPDGRFQETHRALQRGGNHMDAVVKHIIRAMNHAIDAEKYAHGWVYWTNDKLEAHKRAAEREWASWGRALNTAVAGHHGVGPVFVTGPDGRQVMAVRTGGSLHGGPAVTLPPEVAEGIREKHLESAAGHAAHSESKIKDTIEHYRHKLMDEAAELADLGYELSKGPFRLVLTPEMARYAAGALKKAMKKEKPDLALLKQYTAALRSIAEGVYGDLFRPSDDPRKLTTSELAYLRQFYSAIDAKTLVALGALNIPLGGDPHRVGDPLKTVKATVANGIMMLMNDNIVDTRGGDRPLRWNEAPASIRFFRDVRHLMEGYHGNIPESTLRAIIGQHLGDFNGFGLLMSEATIPSDEEFSIKLARTAIEVERIVGAQSSLQNNIGSSGLLEAAALNTEAAAALLKEEGFLRSLLSQGWDDSTGAGALVTSGTNIPEDMPRTAPEAEKYVRAAYRVLSYAANHHDDILGTFWTRNPGSDIDLAALQRAIGDTAVHHMNLLSVAGQDHEKGTNPRINATDHPWSFEFSPQARHELFNLMNQTEVSVKNKFFTETTEWQHRTALKAFKSDDPKWSTFQNIGTIAGAVAYSQISTPDGSTGWTTVLKAAEIAGATAMLSGDPRIAALGLATDKTMGIIGNIVTGNAEEKADEIKMRALWNVGQHGSLPGLVAITGAAINADYAKMGGLTAQPSLSQGQEPTAGHQKGHITTIRENNKKIHEILKEYEEAFKAQAKPQ